MAWRTSWARNKTMQTLKDLHMQTVMLYLLIFNKKRMWVVRRVIRRRRKVMKTRSTQMMALMITTRI